MRLARLVQSALDDAYLSARNALVPHLESSGVIVKEPVDHIERPRLPWRPTTEPALTECGYDTSKVKTLTRDQFFVRLKEYGEQRASLVTCMTCMSTARNWPTWDVDSRLALQREITWEGPHYSSFRGKVYLQERNGHRLKDELLAIAALIAAHPEEFKTLLAELDARQQWLDRKSKNEKPQ